MEGEARYDSLQVKANQRLSHGLSIVTFYTWMRNKSNTNYTHRLSGRTPARRIDPGTAPHIFSFSWSYELPFGRDEAFLADSGFASALVSGLAVRGRAAVPVRRRARDHGDQQPRRRSATPSSTPTASKARTSTAMSRPTSIPATDRYLNSAAFAAPAAFALGNTGGPLGYVRGFPQKSEAFSLGRQVQLRHPQPRRRRGRR